MYDRVKANFPVSKYRQASKLPHHLLCRPLLDTLLNTAVAHGALVGRLTLRTSDALGSVFP